MHHNEVKLENTEPDTRSCQPGRGPQLMVPFAGGAGGGFEASAGGEEEEQVRLRVPHGEHLSVPSPRNQEPGATFISELFCS